MTDSQYRVLGNLVRGDKITAGAHGGRTAMGGLNRTLFALRRRGWIDEDEQITDAGRKAFGEDR